MLVVGRKTKATLQKSSSPVAYTTATLLAIICMFALCCTVPHFVALCRTMPHPGGIANASAARLSPELGGSLNFAIGSFLHIKVGQASCLCSNHFKSSELWRQLHQLAAHFSNRRGIITTIKNRRTCHKSICASFSNSFNILHGYSTVYFQPYIALGRRN